MFELMDHQRSGIAWLRERSHALLADEPGLGKSRQALESSEDPILVVAPAMVLDSGTWDDEIAKWAPGADVDQVSYSSIAARGPRGKVPRDARGNPKVDPKPEYLRKYKRVILDESHYIKNRKTYWTVAIQRLVNQVARGELAPDSVLQMTGTPIPNWAHEAFTALQLAWPEHAGRGQRFGSFWRWIDQWFHNGPTYNRAGELMSPRDIGDFRDAEHIAGCWYCQERGLMPRTWDEFYIENWGDRMLRRYREDCLDLPPFTEQVWKVRMNRNQARAYRALKRDFITWLENGTEIVAWNQASQLMKLVMCTTGLEVLEYYGRSDPRRPRIWDGSAKLDTLAWMLENRPRPTLVTAHFRGSVECCAGVAEAVGSGVRVIHGGTSRRDRRLFVREFQSGNLQTLCASIEVIAEGMTLVAADQIIQVEKSWRPSKNRQAVDRLHRIGQTRPVTAIDLVTEGTVDEGIRFHLANKTDQQIKALGRRELLRAA